MDKNGLVDVFNNREHLVIHTGNINNWGELKMQGYTNSAEELLECIKLQLKGWSPAESQASDKESVVLCYNENCQSNLGDQPRSELRITLKIFLTELNLSQVTQCLKTVCEELGTDTIEQLIVSFPLILDFESEEEEEQTQEWLKMISPVWSGLENLVDERKVFSLGVADLELPELKALYEWAPRHKPAIDHYNIVGCCTVPPELAEYAKERAIQLLTHNDPRPFPGDDRFRQLCTGSLGLEAACCRLWDTVWCARYTVMIRKRSVINAKGYVVRFGLKHKKCC